MKIEKVKISNIQEYKNNTKLHPQEQVDQIKQSITEFGFNDPIAVDENNEIIEGHGRFIACKQLNFKEIDIIRLSHLTVQQKKAYSIAHNKLTMNSDFDLDKLKVELNDLKRLDFDLELTGFELEEISEHLRLLDLDPKENIKPEENPYTSKITPPLYEPDGEKPNINELCDFEKYNQLVTEIEKSNISTDEKIFLKMSASRHMVFNYEKIANYYAHAPKEVQELMEDSALVIIDFDKALEHGYVKLSQAIQEKYKQVHENE